MTVHSRIAALAVALALALPAAAGAQGAGDGQYQDPFGAGQGGEPDQSQGSTGSQGDAGSGDDGSQGDPGSGEAPLSQAAPGGPGSEVEAAEQERAPNELARTGAEPGLIALLGAGLVLTGVGLRVRAAGRLT